MSENGWSQEPTRRSDARLFDARENREPVAAEGTYPQVGTDLHGHRAGAVCRRVRMTDQFTHAQRARIDLDDDGGSGGTALTGGQDGAVT